MRVVDGIRLAALLQTERLGGVDDRVGELGAQLGEARGDGVEALLLPSLEPDAAVLGALDGLLEDPPPRS